MQTVGQLVLRGGGGGGGVLGLASRSVRNGPGLALLQF